MKDFADIYQLPLQKFFLKPAKLQIASTKQDNILRWLTVIAAIPKINALDLDYPPLGIMGNPAINSNSAYRTVGELMLLPIVKFSGYFAPGFTNKMISQEMTEQLRYKPDG